MLDRVQLKMEARAITKNARVSAYLFTLLYLAIGLVLDSLDWLTTGSSDVLVYMETYMPEVDVSFYPTSPLSLPPVVSGFISIVVSLVAVVLSAGYILYAMSVRKGLETPYATMFDGFLFAGKIILLSIVQYIFIFLWSLLFVIPGIVKMYAYSMAYYIKLDHPDYGWKACIDESRQLMDGHKWEKFVLDLSFLGWIIVGSLCLGVGTLWVTPYMEATNAQFYEYVRCCPRMEQ